MKKTKKKEKFLRRLVMRYRRLPRQLRSRRVSERSSAQKLLALTICVPVMLFCAIWMIAWQVERAAIERENAAFRALYEASTSAPASTAHAEATVMPAPETTAYVPEATTIMPDATILAEGTAMPTPEATIEATAVPAASAAPVPTATPTPEPTAAPTQAPTTPVPTAAPTEIPASPVPSTAPTATPALPQLPISPDRTYAPLNTASPDTVVYAMQTPPPVQDSFAALLALNPETVGYLTIPGEISLPVVQRANDNEFYLNHAFDLSESEAGTLFLDGANLLVPEDQNLLIYGHNMKNGTMFHRLVQYYELDFLQDNPIVQFDTIYENRSYVPFAVFMASMDPENMYYMDIRQFIFDETTFGFFTQNLKALSIYDIPVEVTYDDSLLMLVTCEYVHDNGRYVIALRALRPDETPDQMRELMRAAEEK